MQLLEKPSMGTRIPETAYPDSQCRMGEDRNLNHAGALYLETVHDQVERDMLESQSVELSGPTLGKDPIKGADSIPPKAHQLSASIVHSKDSHNSTTVKENKGSAAWASTDFPGETLISDMFPQLQEASHIDLEGLFASLFGLSNVTVAFTKTVGPWDPDWQNHRAAEEKNVFVESTLHSFDACLASPLDLPYSCVVSSDTRDGILAMILKNCAKANIAKVASAFPSADVMSQLLFRFLESHALEEDTWIHSSTFDANKAPPELLMACIASSAMKSNSSAFQRFGKALHSILHPYLFQVFENNIIRTRHLQYVQALALFVQIGLWSGDRRRMEISEAVVGCLVQMLRYGGRYRGSTSHRINLPVDYNGELLEAKWRDWVEEESFKRLVFHMQVHCSKASLTTGTRMPVSCFELWLPLPYHQQLWTAKTSSDWKEVYLGLDPHEPLEKISARELLSNPLILVSLPGIYDSDFAQFILLHCISSMIRDYQQVRTLCESDDNIMTPIHSLANESEAQRLHRLLQSTQIINEYQKTEEAVHRSLLIEVLTMHIFAPFGQIELAAGREGQIEAESAYRRAQNWSQRFQARQAVSNAGQAVRYLRRISPSRFTEFHAIITYQVSLCLWIYGILATDDAASSTGGIPSSMSCQVTLDMDEMAKIQQWINLNQGTPAISNGGLKTGPEEGYRISLSSTQEVMVCLRGLLPREIITGQSHPLISAVYDLMSALSTARPGFCLS
ncbi:hypothetical protein PEBR_03103 [Penicillium brasilianum]|uniref:Xylanolytic transcriptional activator regulatory domain-containing protein n=1 Tax=Penicillium brasilianum TaxID=104259 RepID=A0A1S9RYP6_PENBI|nr:hypothetical protein PEBR_03103 [Penicillium brasilianum]